MHQEVVVAIGAQPAVHNDDVGTGRQVIHGNLLAVITSVAAIGHTVGSVAISIAVTQQKQMQVLRQAI